VYYCGGIGLVDNEPTETIAQCAVYDPAADLWQDGVPVPDMPAGRNHGASCSDGERLFVFGGRAAGFTVSEGYDETQVYDPAVSAWEALGSRAPLPLARGGMGRAVYHAGRCFVFGGEVPDSADVTVADGVDDLDTAFRVDIYDISQDTWTAGAVRNPPSLPPLTHVPLATHCAPVPIVAHRGSWATGGRAHGRTRDAWKTGRQRTGMALLP
jgi:hypothetical protein